MTKLIDFLNATNLNNLNGVSADLAERLAAARPITSEADLLKIEGVTPERLEAWKKQLPQAVTDEPKENTPAASPEKNAARESTKEPSAQKNSAGGRVLLRILFVLIILAGIAAAAYYGIPYFREKVLRPLEANTSRVSELAATQASESERQQEELSGFQAELLELREQVNALQTQAEAAEQSIDAHTVSLAELENLQATLQADTAVQNAAVLASMDEQLTITRALQLLSRSRLYLSQNNYGMAREDISAARSLLFPLLETISQDQSDGLRVVINRLDMALSNLPGYPVIAVFDVDTAWQLLVDGLPAVPEAVVTPLVTTQTEAPGAILEPLTTPLPQQTPAPGATATP